MLMNDFCKYDILLGLIALEDTCLALDTSLNVDEYNNDTEIEHKSFYYLRHGVTNWNKEMLALGPLDLSLNENGVTQAKLAAEMLVGINISLIISSPLKRCVETAEIVANKLGKIPIFEASDLEERSFGDWSKIKQEASSLIESSPEGPGFFRAVYDKIENILPSDAETKNEFEDRIARALDYYLTRYSDENVLFVAHGCVRQAYIKAMHVNDTQFSKEYAYPIFFDIDLNGKWLIKEIKEIKTLQ